MSAQRRPPDVDDEFLTVAEVAAILKLNQQTIRNWTDRSIMIFMSTDNDKVPANEWFCPICRRTAYVNHAR
jgi:hypothetical protein